MQDRYVGDIGDFGKYGLLRHLTGMTSHELPKDPLRLGVVWYRFPDENDKPDGKFTKYLCENASNSESLKTCDPDLYDALHEIVYVKKKRDILEVQGGGILPKDTKYFAQGLSFPAEEPSDRRIQRRNDWLIGALRATTASDLVFVDPDNGITETIEPPLRGGPHYLVRPWHKLGPKYVFMDDLEQFYCRGKSLIIYHHLARWDKADNQIKYYAERLKECLKLACLPWALRYHRGTARAYFIVPQNEHMETLKRSVERFVQSKWCAKPAQHFEQV